MTPETKLPVSIVSAAELEERTGEFAALLHACVHAGASVNFVLPFPPEEAAAFWRVTVLPAVRKGTRIVWTAEMAGRVVGSVQLDHDTPPNQPHRAEVTKLLVHPDFRRRGIARALMGALEHHAAIQGRKLITLDTRTGDSAEPLYVSLGFTSVGVIPAYSRDPFDAGRFDATTIMYKRL